MLTALPSSSNDNDVNTVDLLYQLCKNNEIEQVENLLPFIGNINIINKMNSSTGSTCLHVACYYGHRDMAKVLLEYGALHSIRNLRHNLTPYEEANRSDIKQLFVEQQHLFSNNDNDYDYIEWSVVADDLLEKRREFRQAIDLYKTYDNHYIISKLLAEVIHYYLNEYLIDQSNHGDISEGRITRKQIQTVEACFKEAIENQDYLTYFIKAYTLTNFFYKVLNKDLALYILEYFDKAKTFSSKSRLVNCLVHIITLLIHHPNLPQYQYQGLCYRGMKITQNDLDQYQLNQHILNRAFLSTSVDRQVAEMFAGEGQQSKMRYTPEHDRALQYSCLCQFLIKQKSTAVNIESLSTRPDEKEILILPFSVFKVIAIKRHNSEESTALISIEIQLEECEDLNDSKSMSAISASDMSGTVSLSSVDHVIKDTEEYVKFKSRERCRSIFGFSLLGIILALSFALIILFVINKRSKNTTNPTTSTTDDDDIDYPLPLDCPNILNRSSWSARPYKSRETLPAIPVTHVVVHYLDDLSSAPIRNQQDCIRQIKGLQRYQMDRLGWLDIALNFMLCKDDNNVQPQIYKGRGWEYIGAHCKGYNGRSIGIGYIGNYTNVKSSNVLKSLIQCGILKNNIIKNFVLVGNSYSPNFYTYFLKNFQNDTDLQYSNKANRAEFFCQ